MDLIEEEGTVTEVRGDRAVVVVERSREEACRHCGLCFRRPDGRYHVEATAEVPTSPGDRVLIRIEQPGALTVSTVVFLVPVIALVAGMALGRYLTRGVGLADWRDLAQGVLGLGGAGVAFLGLHLYDRSLRARRVRRPARLVRVLERGGHTPEAGTDT